MYRTIRLFAASLALIGLTACAAMTANQSASVTQFDQAAKLAADAESSFLDAAETVICEDQYYTAALDYSQGKRPGFDLNGACTPTVITPAQIAARKALLNALSLYADKMQALASAGDDQALDQNSIALAQNLNNLSQSRGVQPGSPRLAQAVATAIGSIAKLALDQRKSTDLRRAAAQMQAPIETVVATLVSENNMLGSYMVLSLGHMERHMREAIAQAHGAPSANAMDTFFQIVQARRLLMRADPLRQYAFVSPGNGSPATPGSSAKPVNDALEALVTANRAIAQPGTVGARAAIAALYHRALNARDLYNAIAK